MRKGKKMAETNTVKPNYLGVACGRAFGFIFFSVACEPSKKDTASIPNALHNFQLTDLIWAKNSHPHATKKYALIGIFLHLNITLICPISKTDDHEQRTYDLSGGTTGL